MSDAQKCIEKAVVRLRKPSHPGSQLPQGIGPRQPHGAHSALPSNRQAPQPTVFFDGQPPSDSSRMAQSLAAAGR